MARRVSLDRVIIRSAIGSLHLRDAAIHEQFGSRNVAGIVRCEKDHRLGDLIRRAEPSHRNGIGNHRLQLFDRLPRTLEDRSIRVCRWSQRGSGNGGVGQWGRVFTFAVLIEGFGLMRIDRLSGMLKQLD